MKNAIILHGLTGKEEYYSHDDPIGSNAHWLPWLQQQLMMHDIKADTPEVPKPFEADWDNWVREVERFDVGPDTMLVGHSMGGGFWVRYLSEHPEITVDTLVLVAPWLDLEGTLETDFFTFDIDPALPTRIKEFVIFSSDNDGKEIQVSIDLLKQKFPDVRVRVFHQYGHFCLHDMGTQAFPELRDELLLR